MHLHTFLSLVIIMIFRIHFTCFQMKLSIFCDISASLSVFLAWVYVVKGFFFTKERIMMKRMIIPLVFHGLPGFFCLLFVAELGSAVPLFMNVPNCWFGHSLCFVFAAQWLHPLLLTPVWPIYWEFPWKTIKCKFTWNQDLKVCYVIMRKHFLCFHGNYEMGGTFFPLTQRTHTVQFGSAEHSLHIHITPWFSLHRGLQVLNSGMCSRLRIPVLT